MVFADAFVDRFGTDVGQNLESIAAQLGLRIAEVDADAFEGVLRRIKGRLIGTVALSRSICDPRRRLFTLAHEVAHYLLPSHAESSSPCRPADIESWDGTLSQREVEANRFAAAVLMPRAAVADLLYPEPSFRVIERLAERQGTSLTASAYRYVELSGERVAIAWSKAGSVRWAKSSDEFYRRVRRGPLDADSVAVRTSQEATVPDDFERVDATAWFDDRNLLDGATILEHSKQLGNYGVLTLLWIDATIERWREYDDTND